MTCSPMASSSAASCGQPRRREGDAGGRLLAPPAPGECRYRGLARRRVAVGRRAGLMILHPLEFCAGAARSRMRFRSYTLSAKQGAQMMPKKWTHTAAFAHFGTKPHNVQSSWSARSADGKTVVVTFWQDLFERKDGRLIYARPRPDAAIAVRPGFHELMENLAWARDRCDGRFRVIVAKAKNPNADRRSIDACFPSQMVMKLTHLDVASGAFVAEAEGI